MSLQSLYPDLTHTAVLAWQLPPLKIRVDFVLAFLKLFKQKIILIDKTFSAGKNGFFK
jgi:hypothetical protein